MTDEGMEHDCTVCGAPNCLIYPSRHAHQRVNCPNRGDHVFAFNALQKLAELAREKPVRPVLAHAVRKLGPGTMIGVDTLQKLLERTRLPPALERIDNLLLHLAEAADPGEPQDLRAAHLMALVGAGTLAQSSWVLRHALTSDLIDGPEERMGDEQLVHDASLTPAGWRRVQELLRDGARSRHAFMAMDFKHPEVRLLLEQYLVPEVKLAGFDLRTTEHAQKTAGLIDNRMRVEIRTARFVVVDLTHHNRGAYWEAGFAEGIGRPVFYLCREDVLKAKDTEGKPHFDTAHQTIVAWRPDTMAAAAAELKAMIRNTLPDEATMQDPYEAAPAPAAQ